MTSRLEEIERLSKELAGARHELPALESEITVLRGELMSVRIQLDEQVRAARTATERIERDRILFDRAKRTLTEALERLGRDEGEIPGS
jgi:hypothetical protein